MRQSTSADQKNKSNCLPKEKEMEGLISKDEWNSVEI